MAQFELILPKMGESVAEATVTNWLKNVGDVIDAEESVVEVATDKVDSEVPSPVSGTLVKILVDVNGVAEVGSPIAIIEVEGEGSSTSSTAAPEVAPEPAVAVAEIEAQVAAAAATDLPYRILARGPAAVVEESLPVNDAAGTEFTQASLIAALEAVGIVVVNEPPKTTTQTMDGPSPAVA